MNNQMCKYLRIREDILDSEEILLLRNMDNGPEYSMMLLELYIYSLKRKEKMMPYDSRTFAIVLRRDVGFVERAVDLFEKLSLIERVDIDTVFNAELQEFAREANEAADRQRMRREKLEREMEAQRQGQKHNG